MTAQATLALSIQREYSPWYHGYTAHAHRVTRVSAHTHWTSQVSVLARQMGWRYSGITENVWIVFLWYPHSELCHAVRVPTATLQVKLLALIKFPLQRDSQAIS